VITTRTASAPAEDPVVTIGQPTDRYSLESGTPVTVSGTSTDSGSGVANVTVRIRRSGDGMYWNGSVWTSVEAWVPASSSNGWATWSTQWTPDQATVDQDEIVYITARATDASGRTGYSQSVPSLPTAAISVQDGADFTNKSTNVAVDIFAKTPPAFLRMRVNGVNQGGFVEYSPTVPVNLPGGDGLKTVECEWSNDGSTPSRTVTDTITLDTSSPSIAITTPTAGFTVAGTPIAGMASDSGAAGLAGVNLVISSKDAAGKSWFWQQGGGWGDAAQELVAEVSGGTWSYPSAPPSAKWEYAPVTVKAIARDKAGNENTASVISIDPLDPVTLTASVGTPNPSYGHSARIYGKLTPSSGSPLNRAVYLQYYAGGGKWKSLTYHRAAADGTLPYFSVYPKDKTSYRLFFPKSGPYDQANSSNVTVTPRVYLSTPKRPSSARKNRTFSTYGYLKPRHSVHSATSSSPVRVIAYRYEGKRWVAKRTFYAKISTVSSSTSKYVASVKLPYTGTWKVRACAPTDTKHYSTWSSYSSSFSVR